MSEIAAGANLPERPALDPAGDPAGADVDFSQTYGWDLKIRRARNHERRLAAALQDRTIELKTETWQWQVTGKLAIEIGCDGHPSGLATTLADYWVHELCDRAGATLGYLMFPVPVLREACRLAWRRGQRPVKGGDGDRFDLLLLRLTDILPLIAARGAAPAASHRKGGHDG